MYIAGCFDSEVLVTAYLKAKTFGCKCPVCRLYYTYVLSSLLASRMCLLYSQRITIYIDSFSRLYISAYTSWFWVCLLPLYMYTEIRTWSSTTKVNTSPCACLLVSVHAHVAYYTVYMLRSCLRIQSVCKNKCHKNALRSESSIYKRVPVPLWASWDQECGSVFLDAICTYEELPL